MNGRADIGLIAIDGPAGTGKGTLSKGLAKSLNWHLLESGALYRLVALIALERNILADDTVALAGVIRDWNIVFQDGKVLHADKDVTQAIRTPQVEDLSSRVSQLIEVRNELMDYQHSCLRPPGLIAEGRDMGTVVFKTAPLKVFLSAGDECRAERRYLQLKEANQKDVKIADLLKDIRMRDKRDRNRKISPLTPATDAIVIDSTHMSVDQVQSKVLDLWEKKNKK
jgi:cytidylate kinase